MATPGEREDPEKKVYKWTPNQVRHLIRYRTSKEDLFTKKKYAAKALWEKLIKELDLEGKVTTAQVSKKWENLKKKYKDLKTPKTGSGTDCGEVTAATWIFYEDMHAALGARPSVQPPVLVASYEDPTQILMNIINPPLSPVSSPSTQAESTENTLEEASTSSAPSPASAGSASDPPPTSASSSKRAAGLLPSSPPPKKRKNPVLDFLKEESAKEQQRHEESEAKMDRFLSLFEQLVNKIPDKQ